MKCYDLIKWYYGNTCAKRSKVPYIKHMIEITSTRGSGPGGQHRNKVESAIRAVHIPTGISVFIAKSVNIS